MTTQWVECDGREDRTEHTVGPLKQTTGPGKASGGGGTGVWIKEDDQVLGIIASGALDFYVFLQAVNQHGDRTKAKPATIGKPFPSERESHLGEKPGALKGCCWLVGASVQVRMRGRQPQPAPSLTAPRMVWWGEHDPNTAGRAREGLGPISASLHPSTTHIDSLLLH